MTKKLQLGIACVAALIIIFFAVRGFMEKKSDTQPEESTIMNTNGVLHTVELDSVLSGGPEENDIPPIYAPQFISTEDASALYENTDRGVAVTYGAVDRFYPLKILGWHQLVEDTIDDLRIFITFSPLSNSAAVFRPYVDGQVVTFNNTGNLWDSNLVFSDTLTQSQWSQIKAEAIVGPQSGAALEMLPSGMTTFGEWKEAHPNGQILKRPEGSSYDYTRDPNQAYYESDTIYFPALKEDTRLAAKATVLGLKIGNTTKAYPIELITEKGSLSDSINGTRISILRSADGVIHVSTTANEQKIELPAMQTYWFAWVGAYPDTFLYIN